MLSLLYPLVLIPRYRGFESTNRVNPLAKKILESEIALGLDVNIAYYTADNCTSAYPLPSSLSLY